MRPTGRERDNRATGRAAYLTNRWHRVTTGGHGAREGRAAMGGSARVHRLSRAGKWLRLLAMRERQRINAGSQGGQRVIGQFDSIGQGGRKKHQGFLGCVAVGDHGSDADGAEVDGPAILGPNERAIVSGVAGVGKLRNQRNLTGPAFRRVLSSSARKLADFVFASASLRLCRPAAGRIL